MGIILWAKETATHDINANLSGFLEVKRVELVMKDELGNIYPAKDLPFLVFWELDEENSTKELPLLESTKMFKITWKLAYILKEFAK